MSELGCWRRLFRDPWAARQSNQSVLKEINSEYPLEGLMLNLKLQYFGHLMWISDWKRPWCWERLKAGAEGDDRWWDGWMTSPLNGHDFEQIPGDSEGKGSLACCSPWGHKESDRTEWLNNKPISKVLKKWAYFDNSNKADWFRGYRCSHLQIRCWVITV